MSDDVDDLTAFLLARLEDDERELQKDPPTGLGYANLSARMRLEIIAKRRILAEVKGTIDHLDAAMESERGSGSYETTGESDQLIRLLALPYSADARYRPEWAPKGETDGT